MANRVRIPLVFTLLCLFLSLSLNISSQMRSESAKIEQVSR